MRWAFIASIARKEILSTLRDRRAITSNLLLPLLLLPFIMLGLPLLMGGLFEREAEAVTDVALEGSADLPADLRALLGAQAIRLLDVDDALAAVQGDVAPAGLRFPSGFAAELARGERPTVELVGKAGNLRSELGVEKIRSAIDLYRRALVREWLLEAGLDPNAIEPIAVATRDASTTAERSSGQLGWLIPFFIAVWTLAGGQMTAIDATAGEKERGTLEVLLVTPVRRGEVVIGKFLAVVAFGLSAATMAIVGYVLGGTVIRSIFLPRLGPEASEMVAVMGGQLTVTPASVLLLLGSAVLMAAFMAALLMSVTLFARSFKEAQTYVAPMSILLVVPGIALQFRDLIGTSAATYLIPVVNVMLLMDDAVKGSVAWGPTAVAWGTMLLGIAALLAFATANFRRESVLFRS